ncbi:MAG TPA: DUF4385 domain-containing protein [Oligoflexus sp.]|uniref:DUF4385 domain-containing protein n=1 Tax=Oligoflexus sp. TaxID=1971216 RepID=UPI002D6F5352|nr:DUF4385 domain-containing protein [Oligoflexus sp.]HYX36635.1 DUF4385 domain-containing protein [Oligoflexus sp.]
MSKLLPFNYELDYKTLNFREHPELYRVGKGEQGVLMVEPYKSEILPHWKFKTPALAKASAQKIHELFLQYKAVHDFVGMDMARKFLQMGFTRARRYANHPSGRKYKPGTREETPRGNDPEKAESARIYYDIYVKAREDAEYKHLKQQHQQTYERAPSPSAFDS